MNEIKLLSIESVRQRIPECTRPRLRTLRERMAALGLAKPYGRGYVTTPEWAEAYLAGIVCRETGQSGGRSSRSGVKSKGSGSPEDGCQSDSKMAALPGDELNEALALRRKLAAKTSATSSTSSMKTVRPQSASR
jgi:hypothetical protein